MENDTWKIEIRRPVRREGSSQYMVILVISFALSVCATRLFLSLAGYPQISSGEIHIAHVLWGGLLLFFSALIPLVITNRQAYKFAAALAGVGIGLFIDEVGKFITQRNDYFYPIAAPIIYIVFMLTLLLVLQMRRQERSTTRAELCRALETLQDWIYYPLNKKDQDVMLKRFEKVRTSADVEILANLAGNIFSVIQQDQRPAPVERSARWELTIKGLDRWVSERGLRIALAIGYLIIAIIALKNPVDTLVGPYLPSPIESLFLGAHSGRWYGSETSPGLYQVRLFLEIALGCLLLLTSLFLFLKKTRIGIPLGFGLLLFYLATLNMLLFYFEQFSTILFVLYQFLLLLGLIYYRTRFIPGDKV